MAVDLDDRKVADFSLRVEFLPRCAADFEIQPLKLIEIESETSAGWQFDFKVLDAKQTKEHAAFQPVPEPGAVHSVQFYRIHKHAWMPKQTQQVLRTLLAAIKGEEHTPKFQANPVLNKLLEMRDLSQLDPIRLKRNATTKPGETKEGEPTIFVNTYDTFFPKESE